MKMLCPHCGVKGTADDSYVGKMVRCPKCETIFEVFSEDTISSPRYVQPSAELSPVEAEPEAHEKIDSFDTTLQEADSNHEYSSVSLEKKEVDETDETAVDAPLVESEKSAVDFPALEKGASKADSSSDERRENAGSASMPRPDVASTLRAKGFQGNDPDLIDSFPARSGFSIIEIMKAAWQETMGAKGSFWAASSVVFLVMITGGVASSFLMPVAESGPVTAIGAVVGVAIEALLTLISVIFTAGLLYMGVRKVAGDVIYWKMVFKGFSFAGQIILATVLQTLLIGLGLLLLILPGVYLAVGYGLTLPLILDRKMSAWEAMEASRKAIHKVWWKVTGTLFLMSLIYFVSSIPLGIGLIWTLPMSFVLCGAVYRCLFGVEKAG